MTESIRPPAPLHYPKCRAVDVGQNIWLVRFLSCLSPLSRPFLSPLFVPSLPFVTSPSVSPPVPLASPFKTTFFPSPLYSAFSSPCFLQPPLLSSPLLLFLLLSRFLLSLSTLLHPLCRFLSSPCFLFFSLVSTPLVSSLLLSFFPFPCPVSSSCLLFPLSSRLSCTLLVSPRLTIYPLPVYFCLLFSSLSFSLSSPLSSHLGMLATYSITLDLITCLKCDIEGRTATYSPKEIYRCPAYDAARFLPALFFLFM